MLKLHSNLAGLKVISFQEEQALADLEDLLINPEKAQLIGAIVKIGGLLSSKEKIVVLTDILEISNAIYVQGENALIEYGDLPRFKDLKYFSLIKLPVVSVSGKRLGKVTDYSFDTTSGRLVKLYIQGRLWQMETRLIPAEQIVSIENKRITVREEAIAMPQDEKEEQLETAPAFEQEPSSLKQGH